MFVSEERQIEIVSVLIAMLKTSWINVKVSLLRYVILK